MPTPPTIEILTSSVLSAVALRELVPDWPDPIIDEWLNFLENFIALANVIDVEIDQKIEDVPTDFTDGTIPIASGGFLIEDADLTWDVSASILWIVGAIMLMGNITVDGDYSSTGNIDIDGDIDADGNLNIGGAAEIDGETTINNTLTVNGDIKGQNRAKQYFFAGF